MTVVETEVMNALIMTEKVTALRTTFNHSSIIFRESFFCRRELFQQQL